MRNVDRWQRATGSEKETEIEVKNSKIRLNHFEKTNGFYLLLFFFGGGRVERPVHRLPFSVAHKCASPKRTFFSDRNYGRGLEG